MEKLIWIVKTQYGRVSITELRVVSETPKQYQIKGHQNIFGETCYWPRRINKSEHEIYLTREDAIAAGLAKVETLIAAAQAEFARLTANGGRLAEMRKELQS